MFSRFQSRRQKRRGPTEDPAAPFRVTRRDAGASSELIDFALIDATVNEWMADLEKEKAESANQAPAAVDTKPTDAKSTEAKPTDAKPVDAKSEAPEQPHKARTSSPTLPGPKSVVSRAASASRLISRKRQNTVPVQSHRAGSKMDRVVTQAIKQCLLSEADLRKWMRDRGEDVTPDWRTLCSWMPERAHALERIAADVYGFRSVLICQMGTLVLADLLTMRIPEHFWRPMMETGVIPVVEHGSHPDPSERVLCVSNDPSSRAVRELLEGIKAISPELAYADAHHIRTTMDLLSQHISIIGAQVTTVRPVMKRIEPSITSGNLNPGNINPGNLNPGKAA